MFKPMSVLAVALVVSLTSISGELHAQFDRASKWVPAGANAIVMVREKDILESKMADAEKWRSEALRAYKSGAALLPPNTERLMIASELDFEFSEPAWQVTVLEPNSGDIDMIKVSEKVKGNLDRIGGREAVKLPGDAFLVKADDSTLISMFPANRQMTSRWLKDRSAASQLSPYLKRAVNFADNNAHILCAFDLEDVADPEKLRDALKNGILFEESEHDAVIETLMSLQGIQLGITVTDRINAGIKVDFNGSTKPIATKAKQLLIKALERQGYMLEDIRNWEVAVTENQISLSGTMSDGGLRQIASLIQQPLAQELIHSSYGAQEEPDTKTRTVQYTTAVMHYVDLMEDKDLDGLASNSRWFEKYAQQIDKLPVYNVDEEALKYGQFVSAAFREVSINLTSIQYDTAQNRFSVNDYYSDAYYGYFGRYYNYYYRNDYKTRDQNRFTALGQMEGKQKAAAVMKDVSAATVNIRTSMSKKYGMEF